MQPRPPKEKQTTMNSVIPDLSLLFLKNRALSHSILSTFFCFIHPSFYLILDQLTIRIYGRMGIARGIDYVEI